MYEGSELRRKSRPTVENRQAVTKCRSFMLEGNKANRCGVMN